MVSVGANLQRNETVSCISCRSSSGSAKSKESISNRSGKLNALGHRAGKFNPPPTVPKTCPAEGLITTLKMGNTPNTRNNERKAIEKLLQEGRESSQAVRIFLTGSWRSSFRLRTGSTISQPNAQFPYLLCFQFRLLFSEQNCLQIPCSSRP